MKTYLGVVVLLATVLSSATMRAQAPAGATGQCKDNSYTTAAKKWQACSGQKGVQTWYADGKPATTQAAVAAPTPTPTAAVPAVSPSPASQPVSAKATSPSATAATASSKTAAAPGGGPGLVWVNTATNVYHCPGGTFYGKTKEGKYMTEADAKTAGARPDRNKACSK